MNTKQLDAEIRARIDQFLVSISTLVRQAAVEAVREALGDTSGTSTTAARRGPARPRKAAGTGSGTKATVRRIAAPKAKAAVAKPATAKPTRRVRRSSADVEAVAAKLLAYVKAKPGQRLEEIGRGLGVATTGLKRPVQTLLLAKALRTEGQKRGTRYFAGSKGSGAKANAPKAATGKGTGRKVGTAAAAKAVKKVAVRPAASNAKNAGKKDAGAKATTAAAEVVTTM